MCEKDFRWRVNELYRESGLSVFDFAEKCGVSRQSMHYYLTGERKPTSSSLLKISKACSVSADWLQGLSDVRTTSADIQNAVETLGITEKAAQKIANPATGNPWGKTLSHIVESDLFFNLMTSYKMYLQFLNSLEVSDLEEPLSWQELGENKVVLTKRSCVEHFKQVVVSTVNEMCEHDYRRKQASLISEISETKETYFADDGRLVVREKGDEANE